MQPAPRASTEAMPHTSCERYALGRRRRAPKASKNVHWSLLFLVLLFASSLPKSDGQGEGKPFLRAARDDDQQQTSTGEVSSESFASVTDSTILFLHVFKCAGTTLREVFTMLAEREGWTGAIVEECKGTPEKLRKRAEQLLPAHRVCLDTNNDLIHTKSQKRLVAETKVLAGHFLWDFRQYVSPPHLMITTLRNPLELFVSAQQFKHREETATLETAAAYVSEKMKSRLMWEDPTDIGFIRRFLDTNTANSYSTNNVYTEEESKAMVKAAIENLNEFWVVGVVEQYLGFVEVLRHILDPELKHRDLWKHAEEVKNNGSPIHSKEVLQSIDQDLVREFNSSTLGYQWEVYTHALQLWDVKCREVLAVSDHEDLCSVRPH
eukprot:g18611.t1